MTIEHLHIPMTKAMAKRLVGASIPGRASEPEIELLPNEAWESMFEAAALHGVLPAVLRNLKDAGISPTTNSAMQKKVDQRTIQAAWELALVERGRQALQALTNANVDAIVVKGATHAKKLYANPADRTFTDVDILISQSDRKAATQAMTAAGFKNYSHEYRGDQDYCEDVWLAPEADDLIIEIHTNLVHNPKLRRGASVDYNDVLAAGKGDSGNATALLFVATAHAAYSHQFDRLQHLVDIHQAASGIAGPIDVIHLRKTAQRCGVLTALIVALSVTAKIFNDENCYTLIQQLEPNFIQRNSSKLFNFRSITDARSSLRSQTSWRRKVFRILIRESY